MKIAIACIGNPRSIKTWSGIPFHIIHELEKRDFEIITIELFNPKDLWYYNILRSFNWRLFKKWYLTSVCKKSLKFIGVQLDYFVNNHKPDIILAIHGDIISYTTFKQPVIIIHDTTFESILNYYSEFSRLTRKSIRNGNKMYKLALERADAAVFCSIWASNSAINYYKTSSKKVFTIPFGANIQSIPKFNDLLKYTIRRINSNICKFLFIGVDWDRKGGMFALNFINELNKLGIESSLTIVGCKPKIPNEFISYVNVVGFLNKSNLNEENKLNQLFFESNAFILPSKAECYGCVFCEANAYGLPIIGSDTGGIPEIIQDSINGLLIKNHESAKDIAKRWSKVWMNKDIYKNMIEQSRNEFDQRLNYTIFINKLVELMNVIISSPNNLI